MKIALLTILSTFLFNLLLGGTQTDMSYSESFALLKNEIAKSDYYLEKKLNRIDQMRKQLDSSVNPVAQFDACRSLFQMYTDLQIDSALKYGEYMLALSESSLKKYAIYKAESSLYVARAYAYAGMYRECSELLDKFIFRAEFPNEINVLYFTIRMELYKGLADYTIIASEKKIYKSEINACLDSLLRYTPEQSVWHTVHLANKLRTQKFYDDAIEVLFGAYNQLTVEDREMAHVAFYMSSLFRLKGDLEQQKRFLAISAVTDVKYAVKEYVSLWKLAALLYDEGDIETAYQFIEISLQDATYSGAYRWVQQIIKILPKIYEAYNTKIVQQRNAISSGFLIITCLLAFTILLSLFVVKQYRKLRKTKDQLSVLNDDLKKMNQELNSLSNQLHLSNAELQIANSQMAFSNSELVSMSLLKETYLSKFIDLCSDYIEKLNDYRVNLKRLLKRGTIEKIQMELDSTAYIESEYKAFLINFDKTFLKLYPNFVMEFNNLLPLEERIEVKGTLLTTELRIFALIRLGITDSAKISRFLRCSINTIYTYRSKTKNKSICPDQFEGRIQVLDREDLLLSC
ncbi:hypothetical protein FAZ15_08005 [Sphingobacterium olei]|uniref:DUF6377 domain-containing protein n=1 Tax=Sphingobacterium olei TaxID=2571155 RepID=A0A4U0P226_9SPHI|nr:DUF6377 domain-containing protein [Sphingobacterium olei]TJZ61140.1 hypothetical protein FAZ15_08005 [Sphingobacterium olei]